MPKLTSDFNDPKLLGQLLAIQADVVRRFEEVFDPIAFIAEKTTRPQIAGLELHLESVAPEEIYELYEEIDALVAREKQQVMLACYLAGAASVM